MTFSARMDQDVTVIAIEGTLSATNRLRFRQLVSDEIVRGGRLFRSPLARRGHEPYPDGPGESRAE